jgi:hypothetical protein
MAGRKKLLTLVKKNKGTLRKCRENPGAPAAPPDLPKAPFCPMSDRCNVLFGMIVSWMQAVGAASAIYTATITILAMRLEEIELCTENIRQNGAQYSKLELIKVPDPNHPERMITKAQKSWKANPAVAQRAEAARHAQALLAELGLSPTAIARLNSGSAGGQAAGSNPWEALANA